MNIFVIGGCHVAGYGIQPHLGFVQQWTNQAKTILNEPVNVTCLPMIKLDQVTHLVGQYQDDLAQADLIIVQLGHYELSWRRRFRELFYSTAPSESKEKRGRTDVAKPVSAKITDGRHIASFRSEPFKNALKIGALMVYRCIWKELPLLDLFRQNITHAFAPLKPYADKVVVLTPFPTLNEVDQWLRTVSHSIILEAVAWANFGLIDTFRSIPRLKSCFLADGVHLNQQGHAIVTALLGEWSLTTEYSLAEPT